MPGEYEYEFKYAVDNITIRDIIQILCTLDIPDSYFSKVLDNPNNYDIMWYYDDNGNDIHQFIVNLDKIVKLPSNGYFVIYIHEIELYDYILEISSDSWESLYVNKEYENEKYDYDNNDYYNNDYYNNETRQNAVYKCLKLPYLVYSEHHLYKLLADQLGIESADIKSVATDDGTRGDYGPPGDYYPTRLDISFVQIDNKYMRKMYIENIKKIAKESIDNIMNAVTIAIEKLQ